MTYDTAVIGRTRQDDRRHLCLPRRLENVLLEMGAPGINYWTARLIENYRFPEE